MPAWRGRVVDVVVVRIVELAREERHGIVATGAPTGSLNGAAALRRDFTGLTNGRAVGGVVKATEFVCAVNEVVVDVAVTTQTVLVVHQHLLGDELAGAGRSQRGLKVLLAIFGRDLFADPRVARLKADHGGDEDSDGDADSTSDVPLDSRANQTVQPIQPNGHQRRDDVRPVDHASSRRIHDRERSDPSEEYTTDEDDDRDDEQTVADLDRSSVATVLCSPHVGESKHHCRHDQQQSQGKVAEEHQLVRVVFVNSARKVLKPGNAGEVQTVGGKDTKKGEYHVEHDAQTRRDHTLGLALGSRYGGHVLNNRGKRGLMDLRRGESRFCLLRKPHFKRFRPRCRRNRNRNAQATASRYSDRASTKGRSVGSARYQNARND